jgi:hypothetical protein
VPMASSANKGRSKAPPHAWKKGQSGNPAGRPKQHAEHMALMRSYLPDAIKRLHELSQEGDTTATVKIVEWGLGKPSNAPEDRDAIMQASRPLASISADRLLSIIDAVDEDDEPSEG